MASSLFTEAKGTTRPTKLDVVGSTDRHLRLIHDEERPLSLSERWRLGIAILVASAVIEIAERLPRLDRSKCPFRFPMVGAAHDTDRHHLSFEAEIVDLRQRAMAPRGTGAGMARLP